MKKILAILAVLFMSNSVWAYIPETTLQIAGFVKPHMVRVGIGDNNFKSYVYESTEIFSPYVMQVFDSDKFVMEIPANKPVEVKISSDMFLLMIDKKVVEQLNGPVRFAAERVGVKNLKRAGSQALYRGELELVKYKQNKFHIVNVLDTEEYLKGVVPNEMPVRFGLEALKAQSVAARNYVLSPRIKAYEAFDVSDSVASQVYFGANTEKDLSSRAVEETKGVVALYNWDLILAQYCSTAGGYTESFSNAFSDPKTKQFPSESKPYLIAKPDMLSQTPLNTDEKALEYFKSQKDSYDVRSPYFRWQREWTKDELQKEIQKNIAAQSATGFIKPAFSGKLDEIERLEVKRRGESGKIIEMDIVTKSQTFKVFKELVIRRLLTNNGKALPSANIAFEQEFDENGNLVKVKAYGAGYGHGVGMSQYGAGFMGSELKMSFDKILKHYYTDISLGTNPVILGKDPVSVEFYSERKKAKIKVDNRCGRADFSAVINGKKHDFQIPKELFYRYRAAEFDISIKHGINNIVFTNGEGLKVYVELYGKD